MLRFESLKKNYGAHCVFASLDGNFGIGAVAITGANGTGKSTLMNLLSSAITADAGGIWIDGHHLARDSVKAKQSLGYVPGDCPVYPFLTGCDYLRFIATVKRVALEMSEFEPLSGFGIHSLLDTRFGAMSLGTQRKFMLSAALIGDPPVLLIDEPTNALDADSLKFLIAVVRSRSTSRLTLFTTHDREFIASTGAREVPLLSLERVPASQPVAAR